MVFFGMLGMALVQLNMNYLYSSNQKEMVENGILNLKKEYSDV
ncbi:hypothetical protein SAMN04489758_11434 [Thomasclavelia cocleata]|uniref:Uncharacterized protein n=1 Tax=Thomasclavelia cocleata TaxID=69824 RepID=A0A1I0EWJ4_9FIRM|nr:hypothetical protein SAMN04489758_11434 [Thomasclavelia cocleata]